MQCKLVAFVVLAMVAGPLCASVAPPRDQKEKGFPVVRTTDEREVVVEDTVNDFRLSLPGFYWECKTPGQISSERQGQGGGCSPGGQVPESLLLVVRNEDARAAASLELKGERFRMRGKQDLEEYLDRRHQMVMEQGGGAFELQDSSYTQKDGMITHRAVFTASGDRGRQKYVLVDYFVRPEGEKARVYQLACIATPEGYERLKPDFEHLIGSFEFTGQAAEGFFTPEASPAELPKVEESQGPMEQCGGGYSGMFIAAAVVFVIYMLIKKRSQKSGL